MSLEGFELAEFLWESGKPILKITGVDKNTVWFRRVPFNDSRYGPWNSLTYAITDSVTWNKRSPCIYIIKGDDNKYRYVGKSDNRLKDRWRLSPAINSEKEPVEKQLFHSQCMKFLQKELSESDIVFEVRAIFSDKPNINKMEANLRLSKNSDFLFWNKQ